MWLTSNRGAASTGAPLNSLWLALWACFLSLGWLLPNHYVPWPNFQSDLWIAALMGSAALVVVWHARQTHWTWFCLAAPAVVAVPLLQWACGLLPFAGQAWVAAAYLLGFAIALLAGAQWERIAPGQAAAGLFFAIGAAAISSVGLQLYQWLVENGGGSIWLVYSPADRPHANFAQPNLLGTFLLWGLIACAWAAQERKIRAPVAILMAVFLLCGIALTHSRTALVGLIGAVAAVWLWRRIWNDRRVPWAVTALVCFYLLFLASLAHLNEFLMLEIEEVDMVAKMRGEVRVLVYQTFSDAVLRQPWWGYGWSETARAQLAVTQDHAGLRGMFFHAHNLFLDLVLWCGIPLGMVIVAALLAWFVGRIRRVADAREALLMLFVMAVAWHSMTELPLHYASFLLPTGLVMGMLDARCGRAVARTRNWIALAVCAAAAALLVLLARDYFEVEANFRALRMERAGIIRGTAMAPPEVVVLTQLQAYVRQMRTELKSGLSPAELQTIYDLANSFPSEATLFTLIQALVLNGRQDEAGQWLVKLAKVTMRERYDYLQRVWQYEAGREPALRTLAWPAWS